MQFVVNIPENFSRDLLRGDRPALLVEADATDPAATGFALGSLNALISQRAARTTSKARSTFLSATDGPIDLRVHALYNPESITQYNIVPGLMGVILTMTMIMITGLAITRERERGTMENLLSMPTRPSEVLIGKIVPYILVGYIQVAVILVAARFLFHVPMHGSIPLLLVGRASSSSPPIWRMGITFSTVAKNQLQAMQMTFFFFLPSHPALGLHVSVPRHAGLGAGDRRSVPAHAFPAHRPRHAAQGQRPGRRRARDLAASRSSRPSC